MDVSVFQAIMIGIACWLGSIENPQPLGLALSDMLARPIVGGAIIGLILGDLGTGVAIGAAIQAMYLGNVVAGGVAAADMSFVSYPSIALAMIAGADTTVAVTLATTIGVLGAALFTAYETFMSVFNAMADRQLAKGNIEGMRRVYIFGPMLTSFTMRFGITLVTVLLGATFAQNFLNSIPEIILHIMSVLGGVLPAVGIAILLSNTVKDKKMFAFFLLGIIMISSKMNMVTVAVVAGCLAVIFYMLSNNNGNSSSNSNSSSTFEDMNDEEAVL